MRPSLIALLLALPLACQDRHGATDPDQDRPVNRLANSTSPYLLQHKHNPVDWWPWGPEAIAKARELDRPIFLSIGYAACHWCHVMERESFEDEATAKLMNESFVCIKVDREERPDIDEIYMAATTGMTGHGGWPMSVWMTPDLEPFYAGTYFPPEESRGMPSFRRVIEHINSLWRDQREAVDQQADKVAEYLRQTLAPAAAPDDPKSEHLDAVVGQSAGRFDDEHGGFGAPGRFAPKFPHAAELLLLLRQHDRSGDDKALTMATKTLTAMAHGGIYDQVGGGFHRYSVDRGWLVPHFEKMLYDNAQLARVYAEAHLLTGDELYARIATETLDYLIREMQDPKGGIWSTTDADSEGEEGRFFVWDRAAIEAALGDSAEVFCQRFGVTAAGNFEGHSIPFVDKSMAEVAVAVGATEAEVRASIRASRAKLYELRKQRVPPGTDDKILAAWNGLAITAFAEGYIAFGDERYLEAARRVAEFVLSELRDGEGGRLRRSWRRGRAQLDAYLEDYAFVADGLLRLFECDFDPRWLREARGMLATIDEHFGDDESGSFFFTADDHEELIARTRSVSESSMPSGIAVAVTAHLRGSLLCGDEELWQRGMRALRAHHTEISKYGIACPALMLAVDFALGDPREVVIVGSRSEPASQALVDAARRAAPRRHVVMLVDEGNRGGLTELTSIIEGKTEFDGLPAAFVCRRGTCEAPVTDASLLRLR